MKPALFLDRDGVIIENRPDYVCSWKDVEIFPTAVEALVKMATSSYHIVFVTNQSAVGRGIISLETAQAINQQLKLELIERGCRVDAILVCPHAPEDHCFCRKPLPGLLFQAAKSLQIDLANSIMIGDAWTDLQAGKAAGISQLALVLTGRGYQQAALPRPVEIMEAGIYADIRTALDNLVPWL